MHSTSSSGDDSYPRPRQGATSNERRRSRPFSTSFKVSLERLEEFRRIYKEAHGEEITSEEASAMIHPLLAVYKLLSQPLPENEEPSPSPPPPAPTPHEEI
jgi:hypothetical protein